MSRYRLLVLHGELLSTSYQAFRRVIYSPPPLPPRLRTCDVLSARPISPQKTVYLLMIVILISVSVNILNMNNKKTIKSFFVDSPLINLVSIVPSKRAAFSFTDPLKTNGLYNFLILFSSDHILISLLGLIPSIFDAISTNLRSISANSRVPINKSTCLFLNYRVGCHFKILLFHITFSSLSPSSCVYYAPPICI